MGSRHVVRVESLARQLIHFKLQVEFEHLNQLHRQGRKGALQQTKARDQQRVLQIHFEEATRWNLRQEVGEEFQTTLDKEFLVLVATLVIQNTTQQFKKVSNKASL